MKKRVFGRIVIVLSLALLTACSARKEEEAREWLTISVQAQVDATKSTLSDDGSVTSFTFEKGDLIGLFANRVLNNFKLTCTDFKSGNFSGKCLVAGDQTTSRTQVDYYAYYPYSALAGDDPQALRGILPATQSAPFDSRADFLVAEPVTDKYDVEDFPALSLNFDTHLFAVVKLNITNSDDAYAGEEILSIGLQSADAPLAGQFTFSAVDGEVTFTEDPNYSNKKVLVEYATPPTLGTETTHSVYAVVNATSYASGTLMLVVNTTNYIFTIPSQKALKLKSYKMTSLAAADLAGATREKRVKTIVLWGDSITGPGMTKGVQTQLGPNWRVINCGFSGDSAYQIAAKQGGLPMVTQNSPITLPASSEEYVYVDGLYWRDGEEGNYTYGIATKSSTYRLNPLIIQGVECEMSVDPNNRTKLRRLADGEEMVIPARTEVSTYGSRAFVDADVIQIYMGTNGRPSDNKLIELHDKMKAHMTNPNAVTFVLGFYNSPTDFPKHWNQDYVDAMSAHFGDYFIDQRTLGGGENAIPLMLEMGQITDESQISETDWTYINRGDWPLSWTRGYGDVHPNYEYGNVVQAILLRRRMAELGLL